jgi:hypothetical protein
VYGASRSVCESLTWLRGFYGFIRLWVYTVGVITLALGLIVGILLAVAGVCLFGEDY